MWSFNHMAAGMFPKVGPGDTPYKHKLAGRPLGYLAALAEFKGDWKMMSEVVGLPAWNSKVGICWRCNITLDNVAMVGEDAPWRLPANRVVSQRPSPVIAEKRIPVQGL